MMTASESSTRDAKLEGGERGDDDERRGARTERTGRRDGTGRRSRSIRFDRLQRRRRD